MPIGLVRMSASPGLSPPLRSAAVARHEPVDGEAERQLRALAGVAADERAAGLAQHLVRAGHHRGQVGLDLGFEPVGHGRDRQRRLRLAAHGIDVAERMVGGDLAEHVGVVDDGAEIIDGLQREPFAADIDERRVIRRVEADDDVARVRPARSRRARARARSRRPWRRSRRSAWRWRKSPAAPADRRAARAAAGGVGHLGQLVELAHEAAIDPVLPAPHPGALERPDRCGCRPHIARRSRRDRAPRAAGETAAAAGRSGCGGYCRRAPGRRARRRRPTSAGRGAGNAMVSPAAKTSSCPTTRSVSSTLRKPRWSSGNPVFASQRAGAACVVHRISSASIGAWPSSSSRPASTRVTGAPVTTRDAARGENAAEARAERRRKARQDVGEHRRPGRTTARRHRIRRA